ncbi:MAG: autotransporter outer membrane beta-barrel domain-containing protein, partial [Gammaproteobacteria bacterium]|nr:autotransporter outer membrane beta-barrel domain-containing protein [Gammaproteobacteria bacterium]
AGPNHTATGLNSGDKMRISSPYDGSWWLKGFGGYRDLDGSGTSVDSKNRFGGAMMGFDRKGGGDTTLGLFVGLSRGELEVDYNAQDIETTSYFAGIYGRYGDNLSFAITGGITGHDSDRYVANNLVAGGIETAKTDYDGYFVAPEVTFSMDAIAFGSIKVKPSIRARYTYFNIDGYAESGTASNLTVEDRDGHTLDGRLQLAFPIRSEPGLNFELRAGVDGRVATGDRDVDATLLGQALSFSPGGEESSVSVFIGGHYIKRLSANSSLFFAAEIGSGNETSIRADVQAGINVVF